MFSISDREKVHQHILALAHTDARVVAGAVVGSLAHGPGDRWSDLDLTFGVVDDVPIETVLEDWTRNLVSELGATRLFDVGAGPSLYRVFVLPGCLQCDVSFTPASAFGAAGPNFRLLFGQAVEKPFAQPKPAPELLGEAVHHALRARFCIERNRLWQAEYWLRATRDHALALACQRRGLPSSYARGYDALPPEVQAKFMGCFVRSLETADLRRALNSAIAGLIEESVAASDLLSKVKPQLRMLMN